MAQHSSQAGPAATEDTRRVGRWLWLLGAGSLAIVLLTLLLPKAAHISSEREAGLPPGTERPGATASGPGRLAATHYPRISAPGPSAEEFVAGKVSRFARDRRAITHAMAKRFRLEVASDVEAFFETAAGGNWDDIHAAFLKLKARRESGEGGKDLVPLWGPILETELVSQCAHEWPAQKLLEYGQSVLGTLRPGMVYVGGTDPGRGIPTLLNETSDGERHIVLTQNALADNSYLQYVNFLYGDKMQTLTPEESQRAFQDYLQDAQNRLTHDQQFPDEPKQIRPGEDVRMTDGSVKVTGQVGVMLINERLLQAIMDKNPDLSFALEESFPLKSTYAQAAPLGPFMELRVQDQQNAFSPEAAAQTVDYWRGVAEQIGAPQTSAVTDATQDSTVRRAWSKMAAGQANLLADHSYAADAEQAFRVATEICPYNPEAVFGYVNLLGNQNRLEQGIPVVEAAVKADPQNQQFQSLLGQLTQKRTGK
jgi:hypothetical protein